MIKNIRGISFVIPAKNEEEHIVDTFNAIKQNIKDELFEIIVIDNDSIDSTARLAVENGGHVIHKTGGTIGSSRNAGVALAKYDVIVFVDADVSLTPEWSQGIADALEKVRNNYQYMTGSHCIPPRDGSWIERYWFQNFSQKAKTVHLGTGHLIMSHQLFNEIGGFDESLRTGEDYDICQRAKNVGAEIVNDESLVVIHRDYPKTIIKFIKREMWHGAGDCQSFQRFIASKVAVIAALLAILQLIAIVAFFSGACVILTASLISVVVLCWISASYKFHQAGMKVVLINSIIFYFYYLGRFLSLRYVWKKK